MHYLLRCALCTDFLLIVFCCVFLLVAAWFGIGTCFHRLTACPWLCCRCVRTAYGICMRTFVVYAIYVHGPVDWTKIRTANRLVSRQCSNGNDVLPLIFLISWLIKFFSSSLKEISSIGNSNISFSWMNGTQSFLIILIWSICVFIRLLLKGIVLKCSNYSVLFVLFFIEQHQWNCYCSFFYIILELE